jgi:hypothetical protein
VSNYRQGIFKGNSKRRVEMVVVIHEIPPLFVRGSELLADRGVFADAAAPFNSGEASVL